MSTNKPYRMKREASAYRHYLTGKVVLLIGNDAVILQSLITQLARKGADIALLSRQLPAETMRRIKGIVESFGQRFLHIQENELVQDSTQRQSFASHLTQAVVSGLGHLDIFIDLSAQKSEDQRAEDLEEDQSENRLEPSWQLRQAVLIELVQA